jgi:hypothetical protein
LEKSSAQETLRGHSRITSEIWYLSPSQHLELTCIGDVTRIAPNHISFNDINAIEDIYGHNTTSEKGDRYAMMNQLSKAPPSILSERYFLMSTIVITGIKFVMDLLEEL